MDTRRHARVLALQWLYQRDLRPYLDDAECDGFLHSGDAESKTRDLAKKLIVGVTSEQSTLDGIIEQRLRNWRINRLGAIERTLLRLGAFELLHRPEVPPKVAIHEALDIAREYGTEESAKFINGILDRIMHEERPRE